MKIKLYGDTASILEGVHSLQEEFGYTISEDGLPIEVIQKTGSLTVNHQENETKITYDQPIHFFRAFGLWLEHIKTETTFQIEETPQFKTSGAMMDQSRNAVMTVDAVKDLLREMAVMGLNMLMLYTEDVYEVEERPYFGYMRGKYTEAELKELDDYAHALGIEMVPCIQTLAHLTQTLKWNYGLEFRDTTDILMVGNPKTYEFIEDMIVSAIKPFRTKRIHIGMDEAFSLGLGNYLKKNGYKESSSLMVEHLEKVIEITKKYQLEPMIWSDMYFRTGSKTGAYYDLEANITDEVIASIPKEVQLVYWDYYHGDEEFYIEFLKKHKELGSPPIFAGGAWTWNGISPNYGKALTTSEAALKASKKEGVDEVFVTVWGDNGAETPQSTALPVLQLFAEHTYHEEVSPEQVSKRFEFCTGGNYDNFMLLNAFDETPGVEKDNLGTNSPSKFLLYQDVLTGLYDKNIDGLEMESHYEILFEKIDKTKESSDKWGLLFNFYRSLAKALSVKAELGIHLKKAYDEQDKESIRKLLHRIESAHDSIDALRKSHRTLWFSDYKPFGWEVIDIRYGGVLSRLDTAQHRLEQYLSGEVSHLPELEEERLYFEGPYPMADGALGRNNYRQIVTAGDLG